MVRETQCMDRGKQGMAQRMQGMEWECKGLPEGEKNRIYGVNVTSSTGEG